MTTLSTITRLSIALSLGIMGSLATFSHAHDNQAYNRISFQVEAQEEVANDEIQARLAKTAQAKTTKEIAKILNKTMNDALAIAKKYPNVSIKTESQSTYPNYDKNNTITGFTGNVSIQLKSQNFEEVGQLISDLQSIMMVNDVSFSVSKNTQNNIKKRLTLNATKNFLEQAQAISLAFGATDYKIVSVQLDGANHRHVYPMAAMSMAKNTNDGIKANFESGTTTLIYQASGTIELVNQSLAK
ncbi:MULTISPECIES: SIMPL domain-containing protein [unclassified Moraxella]|uniref:SIMPL domain-containing protein n=1 Tax=unclassified Moraxella TaxID=2685852 RepID=UPI00359E2865